MLVEFQFGNFMSFKDAATLSLLASRRKDKRINSFECGKHRLLKSAAIYGHNASGKSNIIKAISFMKRFVLNSSKNSQASEQIKVEPFKLNSENKSQPSFFEATFLIKDVPFRYGFEVDSNKVLKEWLYFVPTTREAKLFTRDGDAYVLGEAFKEGRELESKTRDNALFLSVVAQFNGELSTKIIDWFRDVHIVLGTGRESNQIHTLKMLKDPRDKDRITKFIGIADLDIQGFDVESRPAPWLEGLSESTRQEFVKAGGKLERETVTTSHRVFNNQNELVDSINFDLEISESEGTRKLVWLSGRILDALEKGKIVFIDELDSKLHPIISRSLVGLFNSDHAKCSQVIFVTHDLGLMSNEIMRRDQIWFTEKDNFGATKFYSLLEYKEKGSVRNDESLAKKYLSGKYGAIPYAVDFEGKISTV